MQACMPATQCTGRGTVLTPQRQEERVRVKCSCLLACDFKPRYLIWRELTANPCVVCCACTSLPIWTCAQAPSLPSPRVRRRGRCPSHMYIQVELVPRFMEFPWPNTWHSMLLVGTQGQSNQGQEARALHQAGGRLAASIRSSATTGVQLACMVATPSGRKRRSHRWVGTHDGKGRRRRGQ